MRMCVYVRGKRVERWKRMWKQLFVSIFFRVYLFRCHYRWNAESTKDTLNTEPRRHFTRKCYNCCHCCQAKKYNVVSSLVDSFCAPSFDCEKNRLLSFVIMCTQTNAAKPFFIGQHYRVECKLQFYLHLDTNDSLTYSVFT